MRRTRARSGARNPSSGRTFANLDRPAPGSLSGEAPAVVLPQIALALQKRRERRKYSVAELTAALGALADAIERHTAKVDEVRRAVEAHGGDLEPLQFYDSIMARFRSELRAAERTLADVFRVAAQGGSAPA